MLAQKILMDLKAKLSPLNQEEVWELGDILEFNSSYCYEKGIINYTIERNADGLWILAMNGDYHADNEYPLISKRKEVLEAFYFATQHNLYDYIEFGEHLERLPEWHKNMALISRKLDEVETGELRRVEQGLTNPIIGALPVPSIYSVKKNNGTYSICIFDSPLKYFADIRDRNVAEYLLISMFIYQSPAQVESN